MKYEIPIIWQSTKTYSIEAGNLQEAVEKALGLFLYEPDQHYIEDSWQIDDVVYDLNEPLDLDSVISKI